MAQISEATHYYTPMAPNFSRGHQFPDKYHTLRYLRALARRSEERGMRGRGAWHPSSPFAPTASFLLYSFFSSYHVSCLSTLPTAGERCLSADFSKTKTVACVCCAAKAASMHGRTNRTPFEGSVSPRSANEKRRLPVISLSVMPRPAHRDSVRGRMPTPNCLSLLPCLPPPVSMSHRKGGEPFRLRCPLPRCSVLCTWHTLPPLVDRPPRWMCRTRRGWLGIVP